MYDYLIVGAGLFGSVCAYELNKNGYKVLVIDKRNHVGGNIYTEKCNGINVHKYGAHIFHTSSKKIWDYINQFAEFNNYINSPIANYKGTIYNLPFNMNTFSKLWNDVINPEQAFQKINSQKFLGVPTNLEEQAKSLVGNDIYEILIKGYTEKQWGKDCKELPPEIIKRIPVRYTYNNNYFNDIYQGIPKGGYTNIINKMLKGIDVKLNVDYNSNKEKYNKLASKIIYTGKVDEYYDYKYGELDYRSLEFKEEMLLISDFQGNAVVNYTDKETPYTRIIEHKYFEDYQCPYTIITTEYPKTYKKGGEAYYSINNDRNNALYKKYIKHSDNNIIFGGRLGSYKYYDMDKTIENALNLIEELK